MEKVILSIDCGTQSLRTMLFSPEGELLRKIKIEYEPYYSKKPGWAEQDSEIFWGSLCKACTSLKSKHPSLFNRIAGVGLTTQRDTMINVDDQGRPLRPAILWLDQRKAKRVYQPRGVMKLIYAAVGMDEAIAKTQMDGKCNWIKQNQPEIWNNTHKYLQVSGFLNFKLTGNFVDSIASQIGHIPFNYKKTRWASKIELCGLMFPIKNEKLVDLVRPGEHIGKITRKASEQTGIPEGVPVIGCGSDKGCETIGMGVIDESMASLSFGTTATVQTTTGKYCEPIRFMPAYPAPIPDHFNPEVEIFRGYWMITWFKNEFAQMEVLEADKMGVPPEEILNKILKQTPAGSMGLMVQPLWSPGLKHPSAKGAIIGFGDVHKRAHVYRAVIEGLAYALLEGIQKIEKATGKKIEKLAVSGGASQSDEICQISADIFNLPLVRGSTFENAGLGAAIITSVGLGFHPSFHCAITKMVNYERTFKPDQKNVEIYRKLYQRVYLKIYKSLKLLYKEVREITGYPEKIH